MEEVRPGVEVRRSSRRRRSVQAYREGGRIIVLVPAALTAAEEARWVDTMVERLEKRGTSTRRSDESLLARALELGAAHLDGTAVPASVRWVDNQHTRWGSCTPGDRSIRLSSRLRSMPDWVVDYVLVHELAHLRVASHGPDFWALVDRFPLTERARGYLEGWSAAGGAGEAVPGDAEVD